MSKPAWSLATLAVLMAASLGGCKHGASHLVQITPSPTHSLFYTSPSPSPSPLTLPGPGDVLKPTYGQGSTTQQVTFRVTKPSNLVFACDGFGKGTFSDSRRTTTLTCATDRQPTGFNVFVTSYPATDDFKVAAPDTVRWVVEVNSSG